MTPLLLRLDRTAEALDVSPTTVKRLIKAGELVAVKVQGATRVRADDLRSYVEHLSQSTSDEPSRSGGVNGTVTRPKGARGECSPVDPPAPSGPTLEHQEHRRSRT